uniref:Adenosine kinase n=1 Tax=Oxyrrhis marina TaxID=2969 RepID=A0A7S4GL89_OXYMA
MAQMLLGMGNPLLDVSANVDDELLKKYDLKPNDAILAEDKHQPLYADLAAKPDVMYIAGGATQNSIRIAQWMSQRAGATAYMGCVGKDDNAQKMREVCEKDGVNVAYMVHETVPTGVCGVCVNGVHRSLVTTLAAANEYKITHLEQAENWALVEKSSIFYSSGFFITVSPDSMEKVAKHACETNKTYCLNLAAPFIIQVPPFKATLTKLMPFVDILFGNETEAVEFAKSEGWTETDVSAIAVKVSQLPKENGSKPRTVVFTQGAEATIVAINGEIQTYPIVALPQEKIVDTNGAGDAYVGGYLSGLLEGKDVAECCKRGAYAGSVIVQQPGATYPEKPNYEG